MKIYHSSSYIEPKDVRVGNLRLEVNSMWDFKGRTVCFGTIYKGQPNEQCIFYNLKECVEVKDPTWTKWENAKITYEIKEELEKMGYTMSKAYISTTEQYKCKSVVIAGKLKDCTCGECF